MSETNKKKVFYPNKNKAILHGMFLFQAFF